ncbi:MAG TPA: HAD-IIIC family phosphatase, partial [Verrucomicrobiae bacterium]|nr:HAD-IIIC family phosphatase [Verrucomicrobiae bacterium]
MFEFEQSDRAAGALLTHPVLDAKTRAEFGPERIRSHSLTNWGEHCTECVWPTCYTTCSFYQPRQDGRCRRFDFGIYRSATPATWMGYSACLKFRNWSMLWAQGNATQLPVAYSSVLKTIGAAAWKIAAPVDWLLFKLTGRKRLSLVIQSMRRRTIKRLGRMYDRYPKPDCFLLEVFNPMSVEARLHLRARGDKDGKQGRFEWTGRAGPGMTSFAIPIGEFERWIDLRQTFDLTLSIAEEEGKSLYFCSATFVRMADVRKPVSASTKAKKIKCVVWDLDNTLWDGILVESGGKMPQLRDGVRSVITELDRRGILLSIASKNSEDDARKVLEGLGLWEYFLAPSINWQPKSASLEQIAKRLNLGLDSFAFVDDMPFERDEVGAALPMVTLIPADQCLTMLGRPEFAGDTAEGGSRRLQYQTEMKRGEAHAASSLGYDAFLATCGIRIQIKRPADADLPRIQDIVQRTNQLNIATQRYEPDDLRALIHSKSNDCYLVSCADNYGDYGQVGFITVELQERGILIRDCMF